MEFTPVKEFAKDWSNLSKRRTAGEELVKYLNEKVAPGMIFKNVLSVGPGDCTIENGLLSSCLQNVDNMFLVEPDADFSVKENINQQKNHDGKVHLFKGNIQEYQHNGPKLDLILLSHCLYYFYCQRIEVMTKLKSWLSNDGIIVIAVNNTWVMYEIDEQIKPLEGYKTAIKQHELERCLDDIGLKYTLSTVKFIWDVSGFENFAREWVGFLTCKQLDEREGDVARHLIDKHRSDECKIESRQMVAVCRK